MSETDEAKARIEKQTALVNLAGALAYLLVMGWYLTPPHQRKLAMMRLAAASRRLLGKAAAAAGRASMRTELATGRADYTLPYALSLAHDRARAWYDRLRQATL